jgi:hypothetical protein
MNFSRNHCLIPLLAIVAIFAVGVPIMVVCASACPIDNHIINFFQNTNCGFFSHAFVQIAMGLFALFALPLAGIFLGMRIFSLPPGFILPPFRPPQFLI